MKIAFWDCSGINLMILFDQLLLIYQKFVPVVLTKRSLIQLKPSIFDPLGLINPVKFKRSKISFPDACYGKFPWNILPEFYLSIFYDILNGLCEEQKILFERVYYIQITEDPIVSVHIDGFCDSSGSLWMLGLFKTFIKV